MANSLNREYFRYLANTHRATVNKVMVQIDSN